MEYMSVKEAAAAWGVTPRYVQRCCTEGRIEGAVKISNVWTLPADAKKPSDVKNASAAKNKSEESLTSMPEQTPAAIIENGDAQNLHTVMPLMNTPYKLGSAFEAANSIADADERSIALGEYYYFSGQSAKASDIVEEYLTHSDVAIRLSACLLYAYANLALDRIPKAKQAMSQILTTAQAADADTPPPIQNLRRLYSDRSGSIAASSRSQ